MNISVILKAHVSHNYKFDEPCFACTDSTILQKQLLVDTVHGRLVNLTGAGYERDGFACLPCIKLLKADPKYFTIREELDIQ